MNGWHHVALFLERFYVLCPRFFVQKNYGARTNIVNGHSFRLLRPIPTPTENAPLARLPTRNRDCLQCHNYTSASRARHGAPKAIEPLRRTGDSMGTAVGAIPNTSLTWPYTLTLSGIYCYNGCVSGTWCYATTQLEVWAAFSLSSPWHNERMASRSFIFRKFLCPFSEILCPEKLRCTHIAVRGHSIRLLRQILTPTENAPLARSERAI